MTALVRHALQPLIERATDAHAGLLIQRGLALAPADGENGGDADGNTPKSRHVERICAIPASDFYGAAYRRWLAATDDVTRFLHRVLQIQGRLLIGLSGGASLETACAVSHTYGVPYIPGSSIKGVARAFAATVLSDDRDLVDTVFGAAPSETDPAGFGGLVTFHDAWWVPGSAPAPHRKQPFVEDVVTSHHSGYYGSEGSQPATDLDAPIPNALIGVHGSFLFTLEGGAEYIELAAAILERAAALNGVGAKTRSGYGYFESDKKAQKQLDNDRNDRLEAKRKADEALQREADRVRAQETMSPLQRDVDDYLRNRPVKGEGDIVTLLKALHADRWQGEEKREVAQMVKAKMVGANKWRPVSQKKNPSRDYDHTDTLDVIRWLEGK